MVDNYIKITIPGGADKEALLALLTEMPFTGFEEDEDDLIAYMTSRDWNTAVEEEVMKIVNPLVSTVLIEKIPFENWNQLWEKNYSEVEIDQFCRIYAPFHSGPAQKFQYEILISPQMAFGTGHHTTTEMMIRLMSHLPDKIHDGTGLDFGTGTGILAILALKMGASHIDAVEIDPYAFQNLKENIHLNGGDWITPWQGGMEQIPESPKYDFILANVTRSIILGHAQDFFIRLKPGGRIIVSGIFDTDRDEVHRKFIKTGFHGLESIKIGKWTALMFGKRMTRVE